MSIDRKRGPGRPPKQETLIAREVKKALAEPQASTMGSSVGRPVTMRYDAAGMGRRMAGWNPTSAGPNRVMEGVERIRNRARDTRRNDWSGESANQKWTTTLVGIGITPRFKRIKNKARKVQIVDYWNDFVRDSDADGVNNYYGQQTLTVGSWLDGGECFVRRRPRGLDEGFTVPLQIQVLDSDMCPHLDADTYPGMPATSIMRSGIELNARRNTRVAYWFYKQHPGDGAGRVFSGNPNELVRVLAADVCHVFEQKRPGQLRGVSMLAPLLPHLRNVADYSDAVLERQKLANLFVGFIKRTLPPMDPTDKDYGTLTNQEVEGEPSSPLLGMQPGILQELEDGQSMDWSTPPEAGTMYSEYMRTQHLATAAGSGLPYELFSGDILNISDRTLRVVMNEFRRFAEQRQWQIIIPQMCDKVSTWFAEAALLANLIMADEFDDVRRVEHAPHGWQHIHPVQDPQGKLLEIQGGLRSRSSVIGERGEDPDMVDAERAADDEREQALKLGPYSEAAVLQRAPAAVDDPDEERDRREAREMRKTVRHRAGAELQLLEKRLEPAPTSPPAPDAMRQQELALLTRAVDLLAMEPVGGKH